MAGVRHEGGRAGGAEKPAADLDQIRTAARQGDADAQDMLSSMLAESAEYEEARRWALEAAEQGHASSMVRLGTFYHDGLGVARDPLVAVHWWRKAALLGDADGQAMLGAAYHQGIGLEPDPVEALAWLIRAESGHSALAGRFASAVRAGLDPADQRLADLRAKRPLDPGSAR